MQKTILNPQHRSHHEYPASELTREHHIIFYILFQHLVALFHSWCVFEQAELNIHLCSTYP